MAHTINWFEIPAKNFERACTFYSSVLVKEVPEVGDKFTKSAFGSFLDNKIK